MAGLRRGGRRSVAPIVLLLLILSLACTFAVQPGVLPPHRVLQTPYTGLRPDWVRLPSLSPRWTSPPVSIQQAPTTWTPLPTTAPTPPQPTPTAEAPPPTETIAIAGIAPPVVTLPPATAAPSAESLPPTATSPPPTESPSPPTVSPSPPTVSPSPPPAAVTEGQDLAYAADIVQLVNETRLANGLTTLSEHPALVAAAQEYADYHAHVSPDRLDHNLNGTTLGSRIGAKDYTGWTLLAENIAWGSVEPSLSPADILQLWLDSPSHRENIMNPTLNETGVGCYVSGVEEPFRICVQDFGARP